MNKTIGITVFIIIIGVLGVIFIPGLIDQNQSRLAAKSVLENVINENYEKAFEGVYFWDIASDLEPEISFEDAKNKWISRVTELREEGTYVTDYSSLRVRLDDTYPVGTVDLIIMENGEKIIKNVRLWFAPTEDSWKLGNLYSTNEQDRLLEALSGNMK